MARQDELPEQTFLDDQVMVAPREGIDLARIAARYQVSVLKTPGPSGYGALSVPPGMSPREFSTALLDDGQIEDAALNGVIHGAGGRANPYQWHLDATSAPAAGSSDVSGWVVAVLDTGAAYEDYSDSSGSYVQAPSLAGVRFVAPYDFIGDDAHPNDDHQHGTHITSVIASQGYMEGVAAGVTIMPLKVLDGDNIGNELALIDALAHARLNGADVINMSLSFGIGYKPSRALKQALKKASQSRIVLVAAAGNSGYSDRITFPAADPQVIAVGSITTDGKGGALPADYSNRSPQVDIMATGGDVTADRNGDGLPDGILAESINYQDPSQTSYWFYAGTSQATAVASGAIVHMLNSGVSPRRIRWLLQKGATSNLGASPTISGFGAGSLDITQSLEQSSAVALLDESHAFNVAVLPYLITSGDQIAPHARLTVLDESGMTVAGVRVEGQLLGSSSQSFSCTTSAAGQCEITGAGTTGYSGGVQLPLAWSMQASAVIEDGLAYRPSGALFLTDALEILLAAVADEGSADLDGSMLAFSWESAFDEDYGDLAEAISVVNAGTGLASAPLGMIMTRRSLEDIATFETIDVDLDGTGLASAPLGLASLTLVRIDGTGLASAPLGIRSLRILALDGTGLASAPLGLSALSIMSPLGSSVTAEGLGFDGEAFLLNTSAAPEVDISGTALAGRLLGVDPEAEAGWVTEDGYEGVDALEGSGTVSIELSESIALEASGAGAVFAELREAR